MKKRVLLNIISTLLLQISTICSGLILPKLFIVTFGSETNGLITSITQLLNYISLLEGGVTGVIMAGLYKPIADNDTNKISGIYKATRSFFRKIGIIYIVYIVIIGFIYPLTVHANYSSTYIFTLTCVLGLNLFIQYFFALSYKVLLEASQRVYITSFTQIIITIINLFAIVILLNVYKDVIIAKLLSGLLMLLQPVAYSFYVHKYFKLNNNEEPDNQAISQRWDGFGQNLAFFIHTNTDVLILTYFSTLENVSVYSVYFMVANSLKGLTMSLAKGFAPSLGHVLVTESNERSNQVVTQYEFVIGFISTILFSCAACLITPFVMLYTNGVTDADYYQPIFGLTIILAEAVYCLREPYVGVAYAFGEFKSTAKYTYGEVIINIILSVALVKPLGLFGIAIGTLLSMIYRLVMHVIYLKNNHLYRNTSLAIKAILISISCFMVSYIVNTILLPIRCNNWVEWIISGARTLTTSLIGSIIIELVFNRENFEWLLVRCFRKNRK